MQLAKDLWTARVDGSVLSIDSADIPADEDTAYQIQDAVSRVADTKIVGFKLGATSDAAISALGLERPFHGPLLDRYCHQSGDEVPLSANHRVLIETEIAVGLVKDLPPRDGGCSQHDVEAATGWVAPAFELVATRLDIELTGNGILLIADGGVNADFVLGGKVNDWDGLDLTQHPATLRVNDQQSASGHTGQSIFQSPFEAIAWLANHSKLRERGLKAGDIITTGTCTGMTPLQPGDQADADLGQIGTVSMRLVTG